MDPNPTRTTPIGKKGVSERHSGDVLKIKSRETEN